LSIHTSIDVGSAGQILKAAAAYFAMVFGTGFVLGTIRLMWVVPRLGVRNAELLEQPLMLVAIFLAAKWIVRRFGDRLMEIQTAFVGLVALGVLLLAEVLVGLLVKPDRRHDPISDAAYFLMLGVFAVMPWLVYKLKAAR